MTALSIPNPLSSHRETVRQLASFGAIGVASTLAYVAVYSVLRGFTPAAVANAAALLLTAVGNTAANRHLTFGVHDRGGLLRDHAAGLVALAVALALTSASLAILDDIAPRHGRVTEVTVLVAANAAATLARFLLLRLALVRDRRPRPGLDPVRTPPVPGSAEARLQLATSLTSERTRG